MGRLCRRFFDHRELCAASMADLQDTRCERHFVGDVQRIHLRHCAVVGLRLADPSLACGDCQRDHIDLGCEYFGDALALWMQGIYTELTPALSCGVV